jgi:hypothetical protein
VTIPASEYCMLSQLAGGMATLKKRMNILETAVKRKNQEETSTKPGKKKKVEESLSVRLKAHPHLTDERFFMNCVYQGKDA